MRRFHFRLDRFLKLKQSERRQQIVSLAEQRRLLADRQQELQLAKKSLRDLQHAYRATVNRVVSPQVLMGTQYAFALTEQRITQNREAIIAAEEEVEKAREALVEKSREVDILERLRRKQKDEHDQNESRRDQGIIDATAVQQYAIRELTRSGESAE